ncbi:MAG TPA: hypothetical protein VMF89_32495, partial [Polyangiales bacterium]|nr:hypothetical protein [Polyangiales bacterium]
MKCWHLVAAVALAGCGLNTTALPSTGRSSEDAGVTPTSADPSIAGSPASWPARRRPSQLEKDGGSSDTKDASKPSTAPTADDKDAQTDAAQGGSANPSSSPSPSGQPTSGSGSSKPGSQAQPGSSSGNGGNSSDDDGNGQNGSSSNGGAQDAG